MWDVLDTTLCNKVCQWLAVSSPSKYARHDIAEILLKVAINSITLTLLIVVKVRRFHNQWIIADKHWIFIVITTSTTIPVCSSLFFFPPLSFSLPSPLLSSLLFLLPFFPSSYPLFYLEHLSSSQFLLGFMLLNL